MIWQGRFDGEDPLYHRIFQRVSLENNYNNISENDFILHGFAVDGYTWQIVKRTKRVLGFGQFDNFRRAFVNIHPFISGQLLVMRFDRFTLHPAADVYNQPFSTKVNRRDDEMLPAPHRVCPAGHFLPGAAPMRAVTARIVLKINLPLHLRSAFPYSFLYCSVERIFRQPTLFR